MGKKIVMTFGTFDLFHIGHLKILKRASELGYELIVGISSDKFSFNKKNKYPIFSEKERLEIISSLKCVSQVFLEESMEQKEEYLKKYNCDVLVMGDDWEGKFDYLKNICEVVYFPRTPSISTTELIEKIKL